MKRTPLQRKSRLKRGRIKRGKAAIVRRRRTKKEFARVYGSKARVEFVKSLPCIVPACIYYAWGSENHHIRTGGVGRKENYLRIVPICTPHHHTLHCMGRQSFEQQYGIDLEQEAAKCEAAWQATLTVKGDV